jgi:hypothetical protein
MKHIDEIVPNTDGGLPRVDDNFSYLHKMFDWQKKFGNHCFEKNHITDNDGNILSFNKIYEEFQQNNFGANDLPNVWLKKFHECMAKELEELEELLPWKHWSSAEIGEEIYPQRSSEERIHELMIELVDIWHFLMSSFMCVGMGPKELYNLYLAKNEVNFERQLQGYNTAYKTNDDNSKIAKEFVEKSN